MNAFRSLAGNGIGYDPRAPAPPDKFAFGLEFDSGPPRTISGAV